MTESLAVERTACIRKLNDTFRSTFVGGVVFITAGIQALDPLIQKELLKSVRDYTSFDTGNDPHGEHDFGAVEIGNLQFFWKIDYYDRAMRNGSDDPADPRQTTRVLTVMKSSEY